MRMEDTYKATDSDSGETFYFDAFSKKECESDLIGYYGYTKEEIRKNVTIRKMA